MQVKTFVLEVVGGRFLLKEVPHTIVVKKNLKKGGTKQKKDK